MEKKPGEMIVALSRHAVWWSHLTGFGISSDVVMAKLALKKSIDYDSEGTDLFRKI